MKTLRRTASHPKGAKFLVHVANECGAGSAFIYTKREVQLINELFKILNISFVLYELVAPKKRA